MASLIKILDNAKFLSKTVFGDVSPNPTYNLGSSLASVNEGSSVVFTLSTTNVSDGTLVPYVITGVSLADLASGALTGNFTVASGLASASITLAADALTEGSETMTVSLSSGVASTSVIVNDTSRTPLYSLTSSSASVNEGSSVTFTLSTENVANGTSVPYVITGVSSSDLSSGSLTGSFTVSNGSASTSITLANDVLTEGTETATLSTAVGSVAVTVNDTSRTPTYAIGRSLSAVDEGSSVVFTLSTTNVANGTVLPYTISGISSNDVTTGSLTGSFTVNSGLATATITMSADQLTEGAETATLTLNNAAAFGSVLINDTSVFTPNLISGLQLWLDAADSSTLFDATAGGNLVTTDGSAVARWADKSGNNRHATQGTANARPLLITSVKNGRNIARFDGSNDFLRTISSFSSPTNASVFIVSRSNTWFNSSSYRSPFAHGYKESTSTTTGIIPISITGTSFQDWSYNNINSMGSGYLASRLPRASSTNYNLSDYRLYSVLLGPTTTRVFLNGVRSSTLREVAGNIQSFTDTATVGWSGGYVEFWNGDICEIIYYDSALTTTQRQSVETYLNSKWAIY